MRSLSLASILALTFLCSSCGGSSQEAVAEDLTATVENIGNTLATAKDEASAKAAAVKLDPLMTHMNELKKKMETMDKPAEANAADASHAAMQARMGAAMQKMMTESMRIAGDPKLSAILQPVLDKMGK